MFARYSAAEFADIRNAATAAGATATSYVADAAIAAARGHARGGTGTEGQVALELLATRAQLRRYGKTSTRPPGSSTPVGTHRSG